MATTPNRADDDNRPTDIPPVADEAGPHDVPDDEVIQKTLPAGAPRETRER